MTNFSHRLRIAIATTLAATFLSIVPLPSKAQESPQAQPDAIETALEAEESAGSVAEDKNNRRRRRVVRQTTRRAVRRSVRRTPATRVTPRRAPSIRANPAPSLPPLPPSQVIPPPPESTIPAPPPPAQVIPPPPETPVVPSVPATPVVPSVPATPVVPPVPAPSSSAPVNQFSLTTKLQGEVIIGLNTSFSGDYSRNTTFGTRVRLNLVTTFTGQDELLTRLQANNIGIVSNSVNSATTEGGLSFSDGSSVGTNVSIDALAYSFPLSNSTRVIIAAKTDDDLADTINPFDGDGSRGALSRFGMRPSIFYLVEGAGAAIRHKFGDELELSLAYLGRSTNDPNGSNGLFAGGSGALAQATYTPNESVKLGLAYVRSYGRLLGNNPPLGMGVGSANANRIVGDSNSNSIGVHAAVALNPNFTLSGWYGHTNSDLLNNGGTATIQNWAVTAAFPNFGGQDNLAGIVVGQSPRVTSVSGTPTFTDGGTVTRDSGSSLHLEGFYQFKVSDNMMLTPGVIWLSQPDHNSTLPSSLIGVVRTTLYF